MKIRIVLLILAIIFGIAAVFGVMIYLNNLRSSIEKESELISVLVATQNIPKQMSISEILSKKYVELKQIPLRYKVEGAMESLEQYKDYVAATQINKGEQITQNKIIKPADIGIAFSVPEGMLAISIPYNEVIGVSNLINVGDRVNVIATFEPESSQTSQTSQSSQDELNSNEGLSAGVSSEQGNKEELQEQSTGGASFSSTIGVKEAVTKILIWNVEVLYIGVRQVEKDENSKSSGGFASTSKTTKEEVKTVTLAVTPEQAEKLVFSEEIGKVWLALVPASGIDEIETFGRTYNNIFN